jgi:hypothetical protein
VEAHRNSPFLAKFILILTQPLLDSTFRISISNYQPRDSTPTYFFPSFTALGFLYGLFVIKCMYQVSRPRLIHATRTITTAASRNGLLWRTAVAAGVKPMNLKALGPEKVGPMLTDIRCKVNVGLSGTPIYTLDRFNDNWSTQREGRSRPI